MDLQKLSEQLPYKRKIQAKPKADKKGVCVAYIDARDVMNILDNVVGAENRQNDFYDVKGKVFCKIGIRIQHERVWKGDSGALDEDQYVESETTSKGETSDAFKRAAIHRWIGRFLYSLPIQYIDEKEFNANKYKLTEFINKRINKNVSDPTPPQEFGKKNFTATMFRSLIDDLKRGNWKMDIEETIKYITDKYKLDVYVETDIRQYFDAHSKWHLDKPLDTNTTK